MIKVLFIRARSQFIGCTRVLEASTILMVYLLGKTMPIKEKPEVVHYYCGALDQFDDCLFKY